MIGAVKDPSKVNNEVVLLHGIHTTGQYNTGKFARPLKRAGFRIHDFKQPVTLLHHTWLNPERDQAQAKALAKAIEHKRPNLIAHSNGARLAAMAMDLGAKFDTILFLAPAWCSKKDYPEQAFNRMYVVHSSADIALWLGGMIPRHDFGWLGIKGYRGKPNRRITNIHASPTSHMGYFASGHFQRWSRFAIKAFEHRLPTPEPASSRVLLGEFMPSTR